MLLRCLCGCVMLCGALANACASDWPQWLGPDQSATWQDDGIIEAIPAEGIPAKWRVACDLGYSGPAVAGGKLVLTDYVKRSGEIVNNPGGRTKLEGSERIRCFSAETGEPLWMHEYDAPYEVSYAAGPRATPTIDGDRVYTLGAEGKLLCLAMNDGTVLWEHDLKEKYGVASPLWGFSAGVLIDGDFAIVMVGGEEHAIVAFHKGTGNEAWRALSSADAGYSTPTIVTAGGKRQLIAWLPDKIHGLDPATGEVFWSLDLKPDYGMSIMTPRVAGDLLFASGIGNVGAAFKLSEFAPTAALEWRGKGNNAVYCANSTPLVIGDVLYGCDCRTGELIAVNTADGTRLWSTLAPTVGEGERRAGHGTAFLVLHEEHHDYGCFLFSETGDLILARLTPEKYEELGRLHIVDPTNECFGRPVVWSHPAFADRCIFARNDKELVCVSLAAE
jgi:outer membrane protein assembly factor BamB